MTGLTGEKHRIINQENWKLEINIMVLSNLYQKLARNSEKKKSFAINYYIRYKDIFVHPPTNTQLLYLDIYLMLTSLEGDTAKYFLCCLLFFCSFSHLMGKLTPAEKLWTMKTLAKRYISFVFPFNLFHN